MVKSGKTRCQICNFVEEEESFTDSLGCRQYVMNLIVIPMGMFNSLSVKGVVDNTLVAQSMHLGYVLITTGVVSTLF